MEVWGKNELEELEPRVLLSGDALGADASAGEINPNPLGAVSDLTVEHTDVWDSVEEVAYPNLLDGSDLVDPSVGNAV